MGVLRLAHALSVGTSLALLSACGRSSPTTLPGNFGNGGPSLTGMKSFKYSAGDQSFKVPAA